MKETMEMASFIAFVVIGIPLLGVVLVGGFFGIFHVFAWMLATTFTLPVLGWERSIITWVGGYALLFCLGGIFFMFLVGPEEV